jgi:protein SCO1
MFKRKTAKKEQQPFSKEWRSILLLAVSSLVITILCGINSPIFSQRQGQQGPYGLPPQHAYTASEKPKVLEQIGLDQRLNEQVPLNLTFRDELGQTVQLGNYFSSGKPVVLALVYYECPMLCNQVLNGLVSSLRVLQFNVGKEFEVVTVSFDPREKPEVAGAKKEGYLRTYSRPGAEKGWHFLTGDEESIKQLTKAVGFRYAWDEETKQFAHASGIMVLTPQGKLSHYFYGVEYSPKDLRLSIVEASENKIGSPVDQLLLFCYHYDPATGKYGPVVMNFIQLGGIITICLIVGLILVLKYREKRQSYVTG